MKVYLAGPMTGYPQFNLPAFEEAAKKLRAAGYDVLNPAELDDPRIREIALASGDGSMTPIIKHGVTWGDFLSRDVKVIADNGLHAVIVLPGWEKSRGARLETFIAAMMCGLPVFTIADCDYCENGNLVLHAVGLTTLTRAWVGRDDIRFGG